MPLLSVKNLSVSFQNHQAVDDISFDLFPKKVTALVGQSGSGKSVTALAIIGLARKAKVLGEVIFAEKNLLNLDEENLCKIRGKEIGFVFQDPNTSLNPLHKIGKQIAESVTIHDPKIAKINLKNRVLELLKMVELESFSARLGDYPHQLSGGQKQRVMLAIALANNPKILIADEPTTALDVTIQNEILNLIVRLKNELGLAVLFITHNLHVVRKIADEIIEMKDGKILHSCSSSLIRVTNRGSREFGKNIQEILGAPLATKDDEVVLSVKNLSVTHQITKSFFKKENLYANSDLNFTLESGHNLGIIGESGSGKSTIALALLNLIPHVGEVSFFGAKSWPKNNFELRRDIQIIFQDPFSSLNPRMLVGDIIEEALIIHKIENSKEARHQRVDAILQKLKFTPEIKNRYPHELSGGQRQRVAIARALILNPKILVLDEPTSALDLLTQNEILKLLAEIQLDQRISYILISHDLEVVAQIADHIMVLKAGQIVEMAEKSQIINSPKEPYTKTLVSHFKN